MRLAWATDIHLNFVASADVDRFIGSLINEQPDAVLITGDIAEAHDWAAYITRIEQRVGKPVWFVLGNHDYYRGSIKQIREKARTMRWLTGRTVIGLTERSCLVGHDGWGDARRGNFQTTELFLNDFLLISELVTKTIDARIATLRKLGDEAAAHLRNVLPMALNRYENVTVAIHVPPFAESAWHEGQTSGDDWLPYFTCATAGEALLEAADAYPNRRITVLCGHTHGSGVYQPRPNLEVITGGSVYGSPALQRTFDLP